LIKVNRAEILGPVSEMSKGDARQALEARLRPLNEGSHKPIESVNFGCFAERWLETVLPTYRESTRTFYRSTIGRWILPHFRTWQLSEVRTPDIQLFLNSFAPTYSRSVLKHIRAALSVMLRTAVEWQYVTHNPAIGARLPQGRAVKRARVLSPAEIRQVIANLEQPYRAMATLAVISGMRESEVLALRWDDIDVDGRAIRVCRSLYRGNVGEPKTDLSAREIPLGEAAAETLRELAKTTGHREGFLFVAPRGGFFCPQRITKMVFRPLAERLGLPAFAWRSFRRSAATAMHNAGVPLKVQQKILGHTDANMSLLYTESETQEERRAIDGLDSLWFPNVPKFSVPGRPN
jgi:integrase